MSEARSRREPLRLAVIADMLEERWPSMDLVAESLMREVGGDPALGVCPVLVRPPMFPRVTRWRRTDAAAPTLARVANRFWFYRRALPPAHAADVFHVVDHSYGHLVLSLPPRQTVVTCHDIDAFDQHEASNGTAAGLPHFLVRRLAAGLARAARVVCPSQATASALVDRQLVAADRIAVVYNGVDLPATTPEAVEQLTTPWLGPPGSFTDLLHVGSTAPRKRLDVLLHVFAEVLAQWPSCRLVRVGGRLVPAQRALAERLGVLGRIVELPSVERQVLAAVYRRATLLLSTSEREGFGLPVAEALAAGTPVVATDLPVFREVGGTAASYARLDDIDAWVEAVATLLREASEQPDRWRLRQATALARGAGFSWRTYAREMTDIYWAVSDSARTTAGPAR